MAGRKRGSHVVMVIPRVDGRDFGLIYIKMQWTNPKRFQQPAAWRSRQHPEVRAEDVKRGNGGNGVVAQSKFGVNFDLLGILKCHLVPHPHSIWIGYLYSDNGTSQRSPGEILNKRRSGTTMVTMVPLLGQTKTTTHTT